MKKGITFIDFMIGLVILLTLVIVIMCFPPGWEDFPSSSNTTQPKIVETKPLINNFNQGISMVRVQDVDTWCMKNPDKKIISLFRQMNLYVSILWELQPEDPKVEG